MSSARVKRLERKAQFAATLRHAPVALTTHFALHKMAATPPLFDAGQHAWAGVVVPKRWAKRAVTRTGIRRQVFAAVEGIESHSVKPHAVVVRLRRGFDVAQFPSAWSSALRDTVRAELVRLMSRAQLNL